MEPPQRDRTTESYKMAEKKAMKLRTEVDAALDWLCRTERECDAGECFVSLDSLVRVARGAQGRVPVHPLVRARRVRNFVLESFNLAPYQNSLARAPHVRLVEQPGVAATEAKQFNN